MLFHCLVLDRLSSVLILTFRSISRAGASLSYGRENSTVLVGNTDAACRQSSRGDDRGGNRLEVQVDRKIFVAIVVNFF